jgi:hypothetical protein
LITVEGNYRVVREAYAHFWSGITSLSLPMNGSPDRRGVVDVGGEVLWVPDEVFRDVEILLICVSSNTETESSYALF